MHDRCILDQEMRILACHRALSEAGVVEHGVRGVVKEGWRRHHGERVTAGRDTMTPGLRHVCSQSSTLANTTS